MLQILRDILYFPRMMLDFEKIKSKIFISIGLVGLVAHKN